MSQLGLLVTKDIVDNQAGQQVVQLINSFKACVAFKDNFLDKTAVSDGSETYLKSLQLSGTNNVAYTDAQIATLRATYAAIELLWQVANGQATVPSASNFFFNAPQLIGTNVT